VALASAPFTAAGNTTNYYPLKLAAAKFPATIFARLFLLLMPGACPDGDGIVGHRHLEVVLKTELGMG